MAALVALALLCAGCGGSSSAPSSSSSASTTQSTPASASSDSTASTTSASSTFASTGNCSALEGVSTQFAKAMESVSGSAGFNLKSAESAYQSMANAAPSAIRPQVQELSGAFTTFANLLIKAHYKVGKTPSPSQLLGLEAAAKTFQNGKLQTAAKQVEAWAVKNCS